MLLKSFQTDSTNYSALVSRVLLGGVLFPHGAQKLLGWFGGFGFEGTMGYLTGTAGLPWIIGFLVILIESIGAVLLIAGFASRLMAASITILTLGIIFSSHSQYFFMNWFGNQSAEGFEYFILMIGLGVSVAITGGGAWSIDSVINLRKEGKLSHAH